MKIVPTFPVKNHAGYFCKLAKQSKSNRPKVRKNLNRSKLTERTDTPKFNSVDSTFISIAGSIAQGSDIDPYTRKFCITIVALPLTNIDKNIRILLKGIRPDENIWWINVNITKALATGRKASFVKQPKIMINGNKNHLSLIIAEYRTRKKNPYAASIDPTK